MTIEVTDANFEEKVLNSDKPVIVDLWAEWCGPCKMIGPIIDEIGKEYEGKVVCAKLDVDSNPETPSKYSVRNIPTILFFKDGELKDKQVGAVPKNTLTEKLKPLMD
ncbi:MAG: thioredoxin [Bacteroidales bacterium]